MNYQALVNRLARKYELAEARAIVLLVLEQCFGMSKADVFCGKVTELSRDKQQELEKIIIRLEKGEPVQYVIGEAWFCGESFLVAPGVLIPRPETEELVEWVCQSVKTDGLSPAILDIGCGSGCIGLTLAKRLGAAVEAWDVSREAIAIAWQNARRLGVSVAFRRVDVLSDDAQDGVGDELRKPRLDVIVSNPPYVTDSERAAMEPHVLDHEPHLALFVPDDDPLRFYRRIGRLAMVMLKNGGQLFFECNRDYAREVASMLEEMGYRSVEMRRDQFGNDRMVRAVKPS